MWPWYEAACANALQALGCQAECFSWVNDFYQWKEHRTQPIYKSKWAGLQNRLLIGPLLISVNRRLLNFAVERRPDVIWFYNSTHIFPHTIRKLRRLLPETVLAQYANDNPFGKHISPDYWRHLKRAIPDFDLHFVYRLSNVADFSRAGARKTYLLRSYYIPAEDYRVPLQAGDERYQSEVVFAGHYEPDGRLEMLEAIMAAGYRLNLFGGGWMRYASFAPESPLRALWPITPVVGDNYRKAISGTKIALCFLSKINRDTYTRRNFQIPAMRTFMLSEYTEDLAGLFEEGIEAEYFRSKEELLSKIDFYLRHEAARERIARAGYNRVLNDGHDVKSRMQFFLSVPEIKNRRLEQCEPTAFAQLQKNIVLNGK